MGTSGVGRRATKGCSVCHPQRSLTPPQHHHPPSPPPQARDTIEIRTNSASVGRNQTTTARTDGHGAPGWGGGTAATPRTLNPAFGGRGGCGTPSRVSPYPRDGG